MQIENRHLHHCIEREDYLKLPGTSFSMLKGEKIQETPGMRIGTLVHRYILKPELYNYEEYDIVRPAASKLIEIVGHSILNNAVTEVPITAILKHEGFSFDWKGIPDIFIINNLVVDFKIINGNLTNYIKAFNYKNQLRGYGNGANSQLMLILAYNKKSCKVEHYFVDVNNSWWENIVVTMGKVIN